MASRLLPLCLLLMAALLARPARAADPVPAPAAPAPATGAAPAPPVSDDAEDDPATSPVTKADPAADKFWEAITLLESKVAADLTAGRTLLQASSDLEFSHAQVLLGNCLLSGSYGFPKDPRKAFNLFRLAAERGNAFAQVSLGSCYATGTGARRDEARAREWLTAALAPNADFSRPTPPESFFKRAKPSADGVAGELANDPVGSSQASAHFLLGQIESRADRAAEAQVHYVAAANAGADGRSGIYQAAVEAALNYAFGRGIPRDPAKAREMLDQSRRLNARMGVNLIHNYAQLKMIDEFAVADLEESMSEAGEAQQSALQLQIAQSLANKKSKDYNAAEAAQWYELAAENGQVWGMLSLALLHARGELGAPDHAKAFFWFEKAGSGDKPKHFLGTANLAICLQQGIGTPKDEARAIALFKQHRDEDIVCYLGTLGQAPTKIVSYEEVLALNQTWAKDRNDAHAQYLLAMRYFQGSGVAANASECERWLKKAAKANHGAALCQLGWLYQSYPRLFGFNDPGKAARAATEAYRASGEAGNIEGLANYANSFAYGYGVPKDEAKAIALYERCLQIDPNHSRAHSNLGGIYNEKMLRALATGSTMGTDEWRRQMLAHYEASARQEVSLSALALGDLYYEGRLVKQDWAKAYGYYEQATNVPVHKATAHYRLGQMHELGQGIPVTPTEAAYHYRIAALDGQVMALRRLVNFYLTGIGVSQDFDRAGYWLEYMVRLNQSDALPAIADVLLKKQEYERAFQLLKVLANLRDPAISGHAHERLSLCYRLGQGVKANPKRAEKHFQLAVERGNGNALTTLAHRQLAQGKNTEALANLTRAAFTSSQAAFNLGQIYYFGTHVTADRPKAMEYLQRAANQNSREAQYFLAVLTWNREAAAPTTEEAIALATKAENLGHPQAAALREKLEYRRQSETSRPEQDSRARSS